MSSRAFQKCKKSKMHVKLLRLKTHFVKIVTVSKILEVPKFQKKIVSMGPFEKCNSSKNACKKVLSSIRRVKRKILTCW